MKKVIGIDLNEVLRNYRETVIYFYNKETGKDLDLSDKLSLEDIIKFEEETMTTFFIDNPIDVFYSTRNNISEETITRTSQELYRDFLYKDYLIEIFGNARTVEHQTNLYLYTLLHRYQEYDFKILVKDYRVTVAPTLLFLSSIRLPVTEIKFVKSYDEIWDNCDVYVTANPEIIKTVKYGKKVIKFNHQINEDVEAETSISSLSELYEKDLLQNL